MKFPRCRRETGPDFARPESNVRALISVAHGSKRPSQRRLNETCSTPRLTGESLMPTGHPAVLYRWNRRHLRQKCKRTVHQRSNLNRVNAMKWAMRRSPAMTLHVHKGKRVRVGDANRVRTARELIRAMALGRPRKISYGLYRIAETIGRSIIRAHALAQNRTTSNIRFPVLTMNHAVCHLARKCPTANARKVGKRCATPALPGSGFPDQRSSLIGATNQRELPLGICNASK